MSSPKSRFLDTGSSVRSEAFPGHSVCYWLTLSSRHNRHRTPPERARQSRFAAEIRIISERLSTAMSAKQEDRRV